MFQHNRRVKYWADETWHTVHSLSVDEDSPPGTHEAFVDDHTL